MPGTQKSFRFGTVSAIAARATTWFLVLFGATYFLLIPLLVYAVPCSAAFKKTPLVFCRPFTLASVAVAIIATVFCTYGFARELDGIAVIGFPLPRPVGESPFLSLSFAINTVLASGCCLLPLCLLSTIDTVRKQKAP